MLFLCTHNAGRSQMALGFFPHLPATRRWPGPAAPNPAPVNPAAIAAMAERGIDISNEFPKPWTDEVVRAADVVITMGCGDACPIFPGKRYEEWVLEDPAGLTSRRSDRSVTRSNDEFSACSSSCKSRARPPPDPASVPTADATKGPPRR